MENFAENLNLGNRVQPPLNSIQLGSDCRSVKSQSGVAAESCNSETASDDHAA